MDKYSLIPVPEIISFWFFVPRYGWGHDVDLLIIKDDVPYTGTERIRDLYWMMETDLPADYLVYRPSEIQERLALGDPFLENIFSRRNRFAWLMICLYEWFLGCFVEFMGHVTVGI